MLAGCSPSITGDFRFSLLEKASSFQLDETIKLLPDNVMVASIGDLTQSPLGDFVKPNYALENPKGGAFCRIVKVI